MYYWLSLFRISSNLPRYCAELHQLPDRRPRLERLKTQLFVASFCILVVHIFFQLFGSMDAYHRFLHYDITLFLNTSPSVNFVPFGTEFVQLFNFYGLYWFDLNIGELFASVGSNPNDVLKEEQKKKAIKKQLAPVRLIEQVYVRRDERSFLFRIDPKTRSSVHSLLAARVKVLTFTIDVYLAFFMTLFHLYLLSHYACGLVKYRSLLFTSLEGLLEFGLSLLIVALFLLGNTGGVSMTCIYFLLHFAFGHLVFLRLSQCSQLLQLPLLRGQPRKAFLDATLSQFMAYHSQTMSLIAINSVSFGQTVLASIITYSLVNSYLSYLILSGAFDLMTTLIMGNFIAVQWVLLGGFHLMAASYARRIHLPKGQLLAVSAATAEAEAARSASINEEVVNENNSSPKSRLNAAISISVLLKLNAYIARLNVVNRYGISYGKFGLISSASFLKFLFIYGKLFMYWTKMNRQ